LNNEPLLRKSYAWQSQQDVPKLILDVEKELLRAFGRNGLFYLVNVQQEVGGES
jgi:hypothetical protein